MNTLAYIKLNKPKGEELDHVKRNAWLFVRAEEGENQDIAIARMKLFSSVCEADGFHIIGESVFIGNETGAKHIIKSYMPIFGRRISDGKIYFDEPLYQKSCLRQRGKPNRIFWTTSNCLIDGTMTANFETINKTAVTLTAQRNYQKMKYYQQYKAQQTG